MGSNYNSVLFNMYFVYCILCTWSDKMYKIFLIVYPCMFEAWTLHYVAIFILGLMILGLMVNKL